MTAPDVTVAIVTRNCADLLPMALAHLEQQSFPAGRFEVLVVDRGSTDATAAVLKRYVDGAPVPTRFVLAEEVSPAKARNRALAEANGEVMLFLDEELLAGPGLVESHLAMQDLRNRSCAVSGRIAVHPQIDPATFTKWHEIVAAVRRFDGQPLRFPDWRICNLSLPRRAILDAGGFDEGFDGPGLEDIELAYRLESERMPGFYAGKAVAYVWRPAPLESEARRMYFEGYSLNRVIEMTGAPMLRNRYRAATGRWPMAIRHMHAPLCRFLARKLAASTSLFRTTCRHAMESMVARGYRDASRGRPPRYPMD